MVGWARDGEEALRKALELRPDLITLDLEMPRMDGFTFLRLLMAQAADAGDGDQRPRAANEDVFKALELGAVDFVAKPTPRATPELATIEQELIRKVHAIRRAAHRQAARADLAGARRRCGARDPARDARLRVVAIGSSTGGPAALMQIFGAFAEPPPTARSWSSQHMPEGFTRGLRRAARPPDPRRAPARPAGGEALRRGDDAASRRAGSHLEFEARGRRGWSRASCRGRPSDKYAPVGRPHVRVGGEALRPGPARRGAHGHGRRRAPRACAR